MVRGRGLDGLLRELILRVGLRARWLIGLGPGGVLLGLGGGSVWRVLLRVLVLAGVVWLRR